MEHSATAERSRLLRLLQLTHELAAARTKPLSVPEAVDLTLRRIGEATGSDCGRVWLAGAGPVLHCVAFWCGDPTLEPFREASSGAAVKAGVGVPGGVFARGRPEWIADLASNGSSEGEDAAARAGLRTALAVPVLAGGASVAVLELFMRESRARDPELLELLAAATAGLGLLIRADRAERAREDWTAPPVPEHEIQFAEGQSVAPAGSFEWDMETDELVWSDEVYAIFGLDPGDGPITSDAVRERIHARDLGWVEGQVAELEDGQRLSLGYRLVRPDGVKRTVHVLATVAAAADGRPPRLVGTVQDVTDRRREERHHRLANERFRQAFENAPIGMALVAIDGSWLQVNAALCEIVGYSRSELAELRFQEIAHPDDLGAHLDLYPRLLLDEIRFHQLEMRFIHADGREVPIRLSYSLVSDSDGDPLYGVAQVEDISERVRSERAADAGRARLQAFIDNTGAAVYLKDLDGRYLVVNKAAAALAGLAPEEWIGKSDHELLPKELANVFAEGDRAVLEAGAPISREIVVPYGDEQRTYLAQKFVLRDSRGVPEATGAISTDITDHVRVEAENRRLEAELQQTRRLEMLGRLAGGIAHDFNNLLAVVMSYTALVDDRLPPDSPVRADVAEIASAAERAGALTQELVVFSRRDAVEAEILDLDLLVREAENLLARTVGEDVTLAIELDPETWPVEASTSQVERILVNLAVNARDAMPAGGTLTIATENVRLDGERPDRYVRLRVSDTGTGMEPAVAARAFDPFFTTKPVGVGSGLGLATVYGAVKQAGGRIDLSTVPGRGTTFQIDLPAAEGLAQPRAASEAASPERGDGQVVLVVEDEDAVREPLVRVLQGNGYEVVSARRPADALALGRDRLASIDLLLTDVVMPEMSGRELATEIRRMCPNIAVMFMSGHTDDVVVRHGVREAEGTAFVQKPFSAGRLLERVARAFGAGPSDR